MAQPPAAEEAVQLNPFVVGADKEAGYLATATLAGSRFGAKLDETPIIRVNLGTGMGYSNLEIVDSVRKVSGVKITPNFGPRRPGDPAELVADASLARELLDWEPKRSNLDSIVTEVIKWFSLCPHGYTN